MYKKYLHKTKIDWNVLKYKKKYNKFKTTKMKMHNKSFKVKYDYDKWFELGLK